MHIKIQKLAKLSACGLNLAQKLKRAYPVIYLVFSKRPKAVDRQTEIPRTSDSQRDRGEQLSGARRLASARRTIDTTTSSKHARQKRSFKLQIQLSALHDGSEQRTVVFCTRERHLPAKIKISSLYLLKICCDFFKETELKLLFARKTSMFCYSLSLVCFCVM